MIVFTIVTFLSSSWAAIGASLANHLWQSTLFAGMAGLLALVLRKNGAQARYLLWLSASAKFLIPFSLLVGMGSHLGRSKAPAIARLGLPVVMQEIVQPLSPARSTHAAAPAAAAAPTVLAVASRLKPALLLVVWFCGCTAVLFSWWLRWRHMAGAMRRALPVKSGRELEALRRLERSGGIARQIGLIVSASALEPGIVGVFHPVMLLPAGMSDGLTDAQLEAIVTHELCHVRRRDNLAAAIHMVVEAIFWFHPLVWWLGARLVDERERACDEEVLRLGSEPQVYAESILKVCQFYLESPLFCVAGVTGSNLKRRIEAIMTHPIARKLAFGKKLLLAAIGVAAVVEPLAIGFVNPMPSRAQSQRGPAASPAFAAVSIKRHTSAAGLIEGADSWIFREPGTSKFMAIGFTLKQLIQYAIDLDALQISGGAAWITSEKYDVSAKVEDSANDAQVRLRLQNLLADQFKLTFHLETKELPVYELVVGKNGPKLNKVQSSTEAPSGTEVYINIPRPGRLEAKYITVRALAQLMSTQTGRLVLDKTGLAGVYGFRLDWTPENRWGPGESAPPRWEMGFGPESEDALLPDPFISMLTWMLKQVGLELNAPGVLEQLGLELNAKTGSAEMLIIDRAEKVITDESLQTSRVRARVPTATDVTCLSRSTLDGGIACLKVPGASKNGNRTHVTTSPFNLMSQTAICPLAA